MEDFNIKGEDACNHINHKLTIVPYGNRLVIECNTCFEEVAAIKSTNPVQEQLPLFQAQSGLCNMDEGCTSCGS